jgi:signal transduction histidine kinase
MLISTLRLSGAKCLFHKTENRTMYYQYHPLLQEQLADHLDGKPVNDPRLENLLSSVNEFYERSIADRQNLELLKSAYCHLEQFAGVVAHDLRAPVRSMASLALWIAEETEGQVSDSVKEKIQLLQDKAAQLEKLINGIMAYSKAGSSTDEKDYVNLKGLLENCIELLSANETINLSLEGEFPDIYTARIPLQQVFLNLISNAMRHAGSGTTLRIRCGYEYNGLVFAFLDNGKGIDATDQPKIFNICGKGQGQNGVGLSITKRLIEQNGGRIDLQSESGKGTCFSFDWPCEILTQGKKAS